MVKQILKKQDSMKTNLNLLVILIIIIIVACSQNTPKIINLKQQKTDSISNKGNEKGEKCLAEFKNLRNYIYQKKKDSLKNYFIFPVKDNYSNDNLWYLSLLDNEILYDKLKTTAFTQKDFDKYFDKLFSPKYVKCLLKVKSEILFEKGHYETSSLIRKTEDNTIERIWMNAIYDKKTKSLRLMLNDYEYENYQDKDALFESNIEYDFQYDENCNLKFVKFIFAG